MVYLDLICQGGVTFDGLAVQLCFGRGGGGMQTRDLLELSDLLDRVGLFGKLVHLSCVGVPSQADARDKNGQMGHGGYWHGAWTDQNQAEWVEQAYQIALSRSFVETITWQDLVDNNDGVLQNGGLIRKDLTAKPAFKKLCRLKDEVISMRRAKSKH